MDVGMANEYWCPHCSTQVDTDPDPGGGSQQEYIEDCPICCRPNRLVATQLDGFDGFEVQAFAEI